MNNSSDDSQFEWAMKEVVPWVDFGTGLIILIVCFWRVFVTTISANRKYFPVLIKHIHCVLALSILTHCIYKIVSIFLHQNDQSLLDRKGPIGALLSSLSGYLLLCTYLILVLFWAVRYYRGSESALRAKILYLFSVFVSLGVWLSFGIAMICYQDSDMGVELHKIEILCAASLQIAGSLVFILFGTHIVCKYKNKGGRGNRRKEKLSNLLAATTIFCTFTFCFRACALILRLYVIPPGTPLLVTELIYQNLYYKVSPIAILVLLKSSVELPSTAGARNFLDEESKKSSMPSILYSPLSSSQTSLKDLNVYAADYSSDRILM